ncbi:MAG: TetR family transcriptional regulator [Acidimicrobiales bacterium]
MTTPPHRSDSLQTQAALIAAAERGFAERGVDGAVLAEINRDAGQRNKYAIHYHFGGRDGLLKAVLSKHRVAIDAVRAEMMRDVSSIGDLTLHDAVSLMVLPLSASALDHEHGGAYYVRIMAQLSATPLHPVHAWIAAEAPPAYSRIAPILYQSIPADAPVFVQSRRAHLMNGVLFHALNLQTYDLAEGVADRHRLYCNDLIDSLCGLLSAPVTLDD